MVEGIRDKLQIIIDEAKWLVGWYRGDTAHTYIVVKIKVTL
jgi:hypothetical protein